MEHTVIGKALNCARALACGALLAACAAHAGPQVTIYLTLPLGTVSPGHVLGMRLIAPLPYRTCEWPIPSLRLTGGRCSTCSSAPTRRCVWSWIDG